MEGDYYYGSLNKAVSAAKVPWLLIHMRVTKFYHGKLSPRLKLLDLVVRNLFMTEIIIELGYSHVACTLRTSGKEVKTSVTQKEKSKGIVWKGIRKNIISCYSSELTINPQPRSRSVRSQSVLLHSICKHT